MIDNFDTTLPGFENKVRTFGKLNIEIALFIRLLYRMRLHGIEKNVPDDGPALLVCNHVTLMDALLLSAAIPIRWREDPRAPTSAGGATRPQGMWVSMWSRRNPRSSSLLVRMRLPRRLRARVEGIAATARPGDQSPRFEGCGGAGRKGLRCASDMNSR